MSCFTNSDLCFSPRIIPALVPISQPDCGFDPCQRFDPCRCVQCVPCQPVCNPGAPSYAFYFTSAPQVLAANQPVFFTAGGSTPDISLSGGSLLFANPGVYLIHDTISLAAPVTSGLAVSLNLNGVAIPGSVVLTTTDTGYSGQAIVAVPAGAVVSLSVSGASTVSSASITAVRISC